MKYSYISAAILALTSSVFGQTADFVPVTSPTQNQEVAAGSVLRIQWQPTSAHPGPISIQLLQGVSPSTLEVGITVAAGIDQSSGAYDWTIPTDLQSFPTFGFKFVLDSTAALAPADVIFQYSFPFHITGLSGSATSTVPPTVVNDYGATPTATPDVHGSAAPYPTYAPAPTHHAVPSAHPPTPYGTSNTTIPAPSASTGGPMATYPVTGFSNAGSNLAAGSFAVLGGFALALVF
ncbi:GPI anchored serine-threonine rich protein [Diplocarpon rosae]|nr:GPI anchored serine-threonine rich protein [Diplocarpon rosae]